MIRAASLRGLRNLERRSGVELPAAAADRRRRPRRSLRRLRHEPPRLGASRERDAGQRAAGRAWARGVRRRRRGGRRRRRARARRPRLSRAGARMRLWQLRCLPRRTSALVPQPLDAAGLGLRRCDCRAGTRPRAGAGGPRSRARLPCRATRLGGARDQAQLVGRAPAGGSTGSASRSSGRERSASAPSLAARALGAAEVTVVARHEHQARVATALGADRVLGDDAETSPVAAAAASRARRRGGGRERLGAPDRLGRRRGRRRGRRPRAARQRRRISTWHDSCSVMCMRSSPPPTGRATASRTSRSRSTLLAETAAAAQLITHRFPLDDVGAAFDAAAGHGDDPCVSIVAALTSTKRLTGDWRSSTLLRHERYRTISDTTGVPSRTPTANSPIVLASNVLPRLR